MAKQSALRDDGSTALWRRMVTDNCVTGTLLS